LPELPPDRRLDSIPVENRVALSTVSRLPLEISDLSDLFIHSSSDMIQKSLSSGSVVLALKLPGFSGKIGSKELDENGAQLPRLGRELASSAKQAGVAGIFHSDELPAYGITEIEVNAVMEQLSISKSDAFALCVAPKWQAELALESVLLRARAAFHRIPGEVRNVVIRKGSPEDGTTTAMRPLPSGARMYPETDIQVLHLDSKRWDKICSNLPMNREERKSRLEKYDISSNQLDALLGGELDDLFISGVIDGGLSTPVLPSKAWASILLDNSRSEIAKEAEIQESKVPWKLLALLVYAREEKIITREGIIPIGKLYLTNSRPPLFEDQILWVSEIAELEGFSPANTDLVEQAVDSILIERDDFVRERGMAAVGPLMGMVMGKLGGSADGKLVSQMLLEKIKKLQ
jgi:glutamyl-tRNA(Gln) amidotransferase subunit E